MEETLLKTIRGFFNINRGRARHAMIRDRVHEGAKIDGIHVLQLICSMLIASIGLNVDSTTAVIGAMLICPLMGSVIAIAFGVASADRPFLRQSILGLFMQFVVCLVTSFIYFALSPLSVRTQEIIAHTNATIWDVLIAFVGGFAGAIGTSRRQEPSTLIAGVAVATALMPPLCATGYGLAIHNAGVAVSALYEFLVNVLFIATGALVVMLMMRVPLRHELDRNGIEGELEREHVREISRQMRRNIFLITLVFGIPAIFVTLRVVQTQMEQNGSLLTVPDTYETEFTTYELRVVLDDLTDYRIGAEDSYDVEKGALVQRVHATVTTRTPLDERERQVVEELIRLHVENLDVVTFQEGEAAPGEPDEGDEAEGESLLHERPTR